MKLWIDDVREPPDKTWIWAKTSREAMAYVYTGKVEFIAFDFDLGGDDTAEPVAYLIERRAERGIAPPGWSVHSANPVGAASIRVTMMQAEHYWKVYVKNCNLRV